MFRSSIDLINGKVSKSLILFAIPIFISSIFQQFYNTADILIVGNVLGDTSLAAIGASSAVYDLLIGFALGIGSGLSIVVARNYGSKDNNLLKKSVATSIVIGIGLTIVIMIISQLTVYPLLEFLNTPKEIIDETYSYISVITLFVGVMFVYNLCAALLRAVGNSIMPLIFLIFSSILNIILDIIFIKELGMGVQGAAVATIISQIISVILCVIYIYKKETQLLPKKEHFTFDKKLYIEMISQGFSSGVMMAIVSSGTVILQKSINDFGYLIIAGHTTARKINALFMMPCTTIATAISTFVSQNKGANQKNRIKKGIKFANLLALLWGGVSIILILLIGKTLVTLISGSSELVVIENATKYLLINAPFYAVLGMLLIFRNSLQGLGKKIIPLISSVIELCGKIVFVILCIPILGYFGAIICEPVIWCLMCLQLMISYYRNPYLSDDEIRSKKTANA